MKPHDDEITTVNSSGNSYLTGEFNIYRESKME